MDYPLDLRAAANRHFAAAEILKNGNAPAVAGYLYGLAAECALKHAMWKSGMRERGNKNDDPFYAHFELLKTLLRDNAQGRLASKLLQIAENSRFMQRWDVTMRYSDGQLVDRNMVDRWKNDASLALILMDE